MALRIEAIASYCGLKGIFKLRAADIYHVVSVDPTPESPASDRAPMTHAKLDPIFTVKALQDLSARIQRADSLEALVDSILEGLEESFGFKNSYILIPTDQEGVLVTMATRGYAAGSVGAEVRYGEGIGGMRLEYSNATRAWRRCSQARTMRS